LCDPSVGKGVTLDGVGLHKYLNINISNPVQQMVRQPGVPRLFKMLYTNDWKAAHDFSSTSLCKSSIVFSIEEHCLRNLIVLDGTSLGLDFINGGDAARAHHSYPGSLASRPGISMKVFHKNGFANLGRYGSPINSGGTGAVVVAVRDMDHLISIFEYRRHNNFSVATNLPVYLVDSRILAAGEFKIKKLFNIVHTSNTDSDLVLALKEQVKELQIKRARGLSANYQSSTFYEPTLVVKKHTIPSLRITGSPYFDHNTGMMKFSS